MVTESDTPLGWGAYPMVPWAGRLDRGVLSFAGQEHWFDIDMAPHAIHGTGYKSDWEREGDRFVHHFPDAWPFGGQVDHWVTHSEDRVRFWMEITAGETMPFQLGWHPWFRRDIGLGSQAELSVSPAKMYEIDEVAIPTGALVAPKDPPWDNCFVDLAMPPRLSWPGFATIELRSSLDHWVIYDEPVDALCVEPQSGPPNAPNTAPDVLETGESFTGWFEVLVVD